MKTLIFNGSPRKNGDTAFLIKIFSQRINGDVKVVNTYQSTIHPCSDCRYCWKNVGCCIYDDMQQVYKDIIECDNIIIASPLYMSELTGSLLSVASRLQTFFTSKRFLGVSQIEKPKLGGIILCGGGDGGPENAISTSKTLFRFMNASLCGTVCSLSTDTVKCKDDALAIEQVEFLANLMNGTAI